MRDFFLFLLSSLFFPQEVSQESTQISANQSGSALREKRQSESSRCQSVCDTGWDLSSEGQGAKDLFSTRSSRLSSAQRSLQLQASGSWRAEEGKTLIGHVILLRPGAFHSGEADSKQVALCCHLLGRPGGDPGLAMLHF